MSKAEISRSRFYPIFGLCLSILLIISLIPLGVLPAAADEGTVHEADIAKMLASGDYVEGEVIAVVDESISSRSAIEKSTMNVSLIDSAETLMTTSEQAYQETLDNTLNMNNTGEDANIVLASNDSAEKNLSIRYVQNIGFSTEELLQMLIDDPRVLSVEPNYQGKVTEQSGVLATPDNLSPADTADLTTLQWGNKNNQDAFWTSSWADATKNTKENFDINDSLWNNSTPNAAGVVAVLDTGIDHTHPDLMRVMQGGMGALVGYGGEYGYNATGKGDPTGSNDPVGHGTHCAGIIASEWNSVGTSGVAADVTLVSVRAADENGTVNLASAVRGYQYLADAMDKGLQLKAINNSWGTVYFGTAFSLAVTEAGKRGAISIFASGNTATDIDTALDSGASLVMNPYAVVVNSSTPRESLSMFSNSGRATTNIVAPGSAILSTLPLWKGSYLPDANKSTGTTANIAYTGFESSKPVYFHAYKEETFSTEIGSSTLNNYFNNDGSSLLIKASDMREISFDPYVMYKSFARVIVPKDKQDSVRYLGLSFLLSGLEGTANFDIEVKAESASGEETYIKKEVSAPRNDWATLSLDLQPESGDKVVYENYDADNVYLTLEILVINFAGTTSDDDSLLFDSVSLGPEGSSVPYGFMDGTSMATPYATGAAAVLAKSDDVALKPSEQAMLRAARLEGSVREVSAFNTLCTSGGALDLGVAALGAYSPVLRSVSVDSSSGANMVTLAGYFFGNNTGTLTVAGIPVTNITSWSDRSVTFECPTSVSSGTVEFAITSSPLDKTGKKTFLVELASPPAASATPLYEYEIDLPIGEKGFPSFETQITLIGLGGSLYCFPVDPTNNQACETLWRYDIQAKEWSRCADPLTPVAAFSATTYGGKILLAGVEPISDSMKLYQYDPLTNEFSDLGAPDGMTYYAKLVNCNETLLMISGGTIQGGQIVPHDSVFTYDLDTKEFKEVAKLGQGSTNLQVAVHGQDVYLTEATSFGSTFGMKKLSLLDYTVTDVSASLPAFPLMRNNSMTLAPSKQGVMLIGASAESKSRAAELEDQDTYVAGIDLLTKGEKFEPYNKRLSYAAVFNANATAHRGAVYAFGSSYYEKDNYVLRATAVETLDQPGDLYAITYYNVEAGEHGNPVNYSPTDLPFALTKPADRENETFAGWYETADFAGEPLVSIPEGTVGDLQLWAKWTSPSDPVNPSDETGDSLSETGDSLPIIPIIVITVLALAVVAIALWRIKKSK